MASPTGWQALMLRGDSRLQDRDEFSRKSIKLPYKTTALTVAAEGPIGAASSFWGHDRGPSSEEIGGVIHESGYEDWSSSSTDEVDAKGRLSDERHATKMSWITHHSPTAPNLSSHRHGSARVVSERQLKRSQVDDDVHSPSSGDRPPLGEKLWEAASKAGLQAANSALVGVVEREHKTVCELQNQIQVLQLDLREVRSSTELREASLIAEAVLLRKRLQTLLSTDSGHDSNKHYEYVIRDLAQSYEQEIQGLQKDLATSHLAEMEEAKRAARLELDLAGSTRRLAESQLTMMSMSDSKDQSQASSSSNYKSAAHHLAGILAASAEAQEKQQQVLAAVQARLTKSERQARRLWGKLAAEKRKGRELLLHARQADMHMSRLQALEREKSSHEANSIAAGMEAAEMRGRAQRLELELSRLQALNEVLGIQNKNLVGWRETVMSRSHKSNLVTSSVATDMPHAVAVRAIKTADDWSREKGKGGLDQQPAAAATHCGSSSLPRWKSEGKSVCFRIESAVHASSMSLDTAKTDTLNEILDDLIAAHDKRLRK
ncbi:hypothetical protein CEUSTIGMA_g8383.t1 [Chlamydomonas eustigma]|uniref:Uncharacterized protein n=1 Tax=Chlamydomonas eustigma TaxID=1157962 RepID=A0A250XCY2_9CHLO|nr:hypothetical protein CEUSTIGMA_g8383.t1 [Chlamydomonas eustigma]|eukprot:GAX80948.1 hypothetical protein CEUSTIGMA_g8383.t1 [Chlamydomonas eustigma]